MGAKNSTRNLTQIPPKNSFPASVPEQRISKHTDVSLRIACHVALTEAEETNLVLSPLLVHSVLSLITAGSDGQTRAQLMSFLKSNSVDSLNQLSSELFKTVLFNGDNDLKLAFANGVWIDQSLTLKPAFKHTVETVHKAAATPVDFRAKANEVAREVNSWAEKKTNGLIRQLLLPDSVDTTTRIIFTNALYFKGLWNQKFDPSRTRHSEFHLLSRKPVQAPFMMMSSPSSKQFISAFKGFKVCRLPYKPCDNKRQFSMYLFLPDVRDGLPAMVKEMASSPGFLDSHLPTKQVDVRLIMIPKFKISFGIEISRVIKQLGVGMAFSSGDLTGMVESEIVGRDLFVSSIFHKACIEVNEEGTEAASATVSTVALRSLSTPETVDFVADHPFMFFIREDTSGVVLFIGHVLNPLLASTANVQAFSQQHHGSTL